MLNVNEELEAKRVALKAELIAFTKDLASDELGEAAEVLKATYSLVRIHEAFMPGAERVSKLSTCIVPSL